MANIITYLKPVPVTKRILGFTLIIFGFLAIFTKSIGFGAVAVAFGIHFSSSEGSQIDITSKKYRKIWSIASIHIGKWKPCPEFEYISVFSTKESQRVNVVTATTNVTRSVILLNLFYGNKHQTVYKTTNKKDAFKIAEHFKVAFNIDILDATGTEKVWL
ncbi:hypothetical protein GCM10007424_03950 [Flavobacterium suaedae]|uniref:Uncharacterized protein n=1 Tax=Flavobacterium suaedae TaxID=1767027 RepID=A0ABQ1JIJ7_9FLAO|nr:hypothetical protein [Flavobacterium suaedae]GGB67163.1 hypothetical protein GCM10007424_03950 [Flavobacterium suaedae]